MKNETKKGITFSYLQAIYILFCAVCATVLMISYENQIADSNLKIKRLNNSLFDDSIHERINHSYEYPLLNLGSKSEEFAEFVRIKIKDYEQKRQIRLSVKTKKNILNTLKANLTKNNLIDSDTAFSDFVTKIKQ